jgi:hypothetical protein
MNEAIRTGGCQCGAIRFQVNGEIGVASICHCRMCQKAFGNYFAALVDTGAAELVWTRGQLRHYRSSNHVERGFCEQCGTQLTYEAEDGVGIAAGAFDDPAQLRPVVQFGIEGKLPFVDRLHELPGRNTMDDIAAAPFLSDIIPYQHPDHDTKVWPPEREEPNSNQKEDKA